MCTGVKSTTAALRPIQTNWRKHAMWGTGAVHVRDQRSTEEEEGDMHPLVGQATLCVYTCLLYTSDAADE